MKWKPIPAPAGVNAQRTTSARTTRRAFLNTLVVSAGVGMAVKNFPALSAESLPRTSLFNGRDITGWQPAPRLPVAPFPGGPAPKLPEAQLARIKAHTGSWTVEDGAIVGGQQPPGSGLGAYLVSERAFGDFELEYEARPDWRADTGVMIRALPQGGVGIQVLCDHRPGGGLGGFYFNGTGAFLAAPFFLDGELDANGRLKRLFPATTPQKQPTVPLDFAGGVEEFLKAWRLNDWNHFRVRCAGELPVLTTWVNGVKVAGLDTAKVRHVNWHPERVRELLGRRGHLAFEVHSINAQDPLGADRWAPGAVCRWRRIVVTEL